jgi:hypothetical protein
MATIQQTNEPPPQRSEQDVAELMDNRMDAADVIIAMREARTSARVARERVVLEQPELERREIDHEGRHCAMSSSALVRRLSRGYPLMFMQSTDPDMTDDRFEAFIALAGFAGRINIDEPGGADDILAFMKTHQQHFGRRTQNPTTHTPNKQKKKKKRKQKMKKETK